MRSNFRNLNFVKIAMMLCRMSELIGVINSLENKVSKLLQKLAVVSQENVKLVEELRGSQEDTKGLETELVKWEEKYNSLKVASTMLGSSNNNKTEAKLKINTLIRELDYCISQLSE